MYAVDGAFFAQRVSGIQRYSIELLEELDKILSPGELEIVVPQGVKTPEYQNIRVVPFGARGGMLWDRQERTLHLQCHSSVWFFRDGRGA